jgi:hypothetical protein
LQRHVLAWATSIAALAACGRLGYDPLTDDPFAPDATDSDAPGPTDDARDRPDAGAIDATAATGDPAAETLIPDACLAPVHLASPPVIDGVAEAGLILTPVPVVGWTGPGAAPPARHHASYALAWRDDGLYLVVAVTDTSPLPAAADHEVWCGAGVELYVDHDGAYRDERRFDDPGAVQVAVAAPPAGATARRAQSFCSDCGVPGPVATRADTVAARSVTGGYVAEILVTAAELDLPSWQLGPGTRVGFTVAINVSTDVRPATACVPNTADRQGTRLGQYFLRVGPGSTWPFETYQAFCAATLTD